ncbi:hypothetical protein ACUXNS_000114 [Brevibacterium pityocampae]|nr:hypothetical protein [Nocardia zapadnayensis]
MSSWTARIAITCAASPAYIQIFCARGPVIMIADTASAVSS